MTVVWEFLLFFMLYELTHTYFFYIVNSDAKTNFKGDRYYETFQINPAFFSDEEVTDNEYSRKLPCWKSDKLEIYFYMYDSDPVWGKYFDKYSTFIINRINP